ncbi:uncharacterized protein METZ01_LOCUS496292, partial [marine metagenome]
ATFLFWPQPEELMRYQPRFPGVVPHQRAGHLRVPQPFAALHRSGSLNLHAL